MHCDLHGSIEGSGGSGWPAAGHLVLAAELLVGDVSGQVGVQDGAEGQAVVPAAAEVGDVDVLQTRVHHRSEVTGQRSQVNPAADLARSFPISLDDPLDLHHLFWTVCNLTGFSLHA